MIDIFAVICFTAALALFVAVVRVHRVTQKAYQRMRAQANRIMAHHDSPRCDYMLTRFTNAGWPVWSRIDLTAVDYGDEHTSAISIRTRSTAVRCGLHRDHTGSGHMILPVDMRAAGYTLPPF